MTNQRQSRPPTRNCHLCGGELEITIVDRPGAGPNSADTVCKKCGNKSGYSWAYFSPGAPETHINAQGPGWPAELRSQMANRPVFIDSEGRPRLQLLLDAMPFPVFGLKGRPMGLRLKSPGGGHRGRKKMARVSLGYRAGDPNSRGPGLTMRQESHDPQSRSALDTRPNEVKGLQAMMIITGAVSAADPELHRRWFREGNMHGDWNIEHFVNTPWNRFEAHVAGFDMQLDLKLFAEPQQLCYFSFVIPTERPMHIDGCSVYISPEQTLETLGALVDLKSDPEAVAENQAGIEESFRLLWPDS